MKLLIGFCGRARHGKDFVAGMVRNGLEQKGHRCFLSTISQMVLNDAQHRGLIRSDITREQCTKPELDVLVKHGHYGRSLHPDHWIGELQEKIITFNPDVALIPGVRFPNEIDWIKRHDKKIKGIVVRIRRFNPDGSDYISPDRDPNDPMETVLNRVVADYEISATSGQQDWLDAQARGLANFLAGEIHE